MTAAELRIQRQRLIRRQWAIADELNRIPPVPAEQGFSPYTKARMDALYAESNANAEAIRAIDGELDS
jgi:hypothetical protein